MAKYSREQIDAAIVSAMQVFGLESLKHQQREAIREFVSGRDVFVSLPTGFGKSYCYALLPTVFDNLRTDKELSIMLCVSPLTALMMEQRDKLCTQGVPAASPFTLNLVRLSAEIPTLLTLHSAMIVLHLIYVVTTQATRAAT